jgi:pimeloyl-ACP methyl ester carboxylesterase
VVAPDLPGLGASQGSGGPPDAGTVLAWLGELIERTCAAPPVLVGAWLGGSIAARFAAAHGDRLAGLVLVDTGGLVAPVRPGPGCCWRWCARASGRASAPRRRCCGR